MRRLLGALVITLCASTAFAGPIRDALPRYAAQAAAPKPPMHNAEMYASGFVLGILGAGLFGWGLGMSDTCTTRVCTNTSGAKVAYIIGGAGIMAAGWTMSAIGGKRVAVTPTPQGLALTTGFRF